jgi:hypothetical protein
MRSAFHLVTVASVVFLGLIACGSPYGEDGEEQGTPKPGEGTPKSGDPAGGGNASTSGGASSSSSSSSGAPVGETKPPGPVLLIGDSGSKVEAWKFDGASWTAVATTNNPSTRRGFMTASLNGKAVLFGGYDPATPGLGETWSLDAMAWKKEAPAASPPARYGAAMVALNDRVILFGGVDNLAGGGATRIHNDTWSWNGTTWKQELGAANPSPRSGHAMATLKGERIVLFGGANPQREFDETWIFETASGWRQLPPNVAHPPACFRCTMAPVGIGDTAAVALVGPGLDTQTWVFDGAAWTLKAATGPSKRISSMAVAGSKIVLFGGYTNTVSNAHLDTWSFDGKEWTLLHPPSTPPAIVSALGTLVPIP